MIGLQFRTRHGTTSQHILVVGVWYMARPSSIVREVWWVSCMSFSSLADHGPGEAIDPATPRRRLSRHLFKCTRSDPLTNGRQTVFGNPAKEAAQSDMHKYWIRCQEEFFCCLTCTIQINTCRCCYRQRRALINHWTNPGGRWWWFY